MDGKELFLIVEAISNEKNISKEDVFESLEEALAVATKKRKEIDAHVEIDRKTGEFSTFRQWMVIDDKENFVEMERAQDRIKHYYHENSWGIECIADINFVWYKGDLEKIAEDLFEKSCQNLLGPLNRSLDFHLSDNLLFRAALIQLQAVA